MRSAALALLSLALAGAVAAAAPPPLLAPGSSVRGEIGGNDPVAFRIDVPAGMAARVRLRHDGIYCVLRLLQGERPIDSSDDSSGTSGEELVAAPIGEADASYEVAVVPIVHDVCGSYEAQLELGPADQSARLIAGAHQRLFEARRLEMLGDAGSMESSIRHFDEAIDLASRAGEPLTEGEALYRSAIVLGQVSRVADGTARLDRVIPLFRSTGLLGAEGRAIDRRGELARRTGDIVWAERDLKAALPLATSAHDYEGICDVRNNLGLLYEQSGRWDDAIAMFQEALPLASHASTDVASALRHNLGNAFSDMGDYPGALRMLHESLVLKRQMNIPRRTAQTLHAIALVQAAMGDIAKARATLDEATAILETTGDPQSLGGVYAATGRLLVQQHEWDAALDRLNRAQEMLRKARDRRGEARVLTSLGQVELERGPGSPRQAEETLTRALAGARETFDRVNESAALYLRARVRQRSGRLGEALADAEAAVGVVESMREAIVNPDFRSTYLGTVRRYFDLVIELLMLQHERQPAAGFAAEAFRANERARARTLLESLARSQADVVKGVRPELLTRERNIRRQLQGKEAYRVQLLRGDLSRPEVAATESSIAQLLAEYRSVKGEIRAASPDYAALEFPEPLSLADVQAHLLDPTTTLLEYHLGAERSYVWVVSDRDVAVHTLPAEARIEKLARSYHDLLRQNPAALAPAAAQSLRQRTRSAGEALARTIIRPVLASARGKRLLIVADGALHYIPFAALPDEQHVPLIASHEIAYLQSATLLQTLRRMPLRRGPLTSVAVFADPVFQRSDSRFAKGIAAAPAAESRSDARYARFGEFRRLRFSRTEAEAILGSADRRKSLEALDFQATKQAFVGADLRRYGIVHIATHGMANAEEPDLSGLVFSRYDRRGNKIDGYLRLRDVYNLDLQAELVVLSACQTALGKAVYGEGLISLTRGFMYGGAKRVMATVWSVDDRATAR
ncbi:MAG: Tetratricopeptide 1 repeat-containing protein, partial [Acidobacteria bacterium]|nr:Tetratricopeptide 1 repeat-containing protein [Acidobacteriota bacterium]